MKALFAVSEVSPIVKVGGLGDVAGSLPKALKKLGVEIAIVIPAYKVIDFQKWKIEKISSYNLQFGEIQEEVNLLKTLLSESSIPVFLLQNHYLDEGGETAFAGTREEVSTYTFFSKAIVEFIKTNFFVPKLIHCNDWHTGIIPLLLKKESLEKIATLFTIHNISYQGTAEVPLLSKLGLTIEDSDFLAWDAKSGDINLLMQGVMAADLINTVSPTYAKEIQTKEFGWQLDEVLKARTGRLFGVLNGLDYTYWNPKTDKFLFKNYDANNFIPGKLENKKSLQEKLGLSQKDLPLFSFIGRLDPKQKGLDILEQAVKKVLTEENLQFVLLGTGKKPWERRLKNLQSKFPQKAKIIIRFDEEFAHQLYAASDFILMPSYFEPCGLPQMIACRYGGLPIVRKVGGLNDSVKEGENGFVFEKYEADDLYQAIKRSLKTAVEKTIFEAMIKKAMRKDFSWQKSAKKYLNLYKLAIEYCRQNEV